MANNPYPHLRHESTYFSDKYDKLEGAAISGTANAGLWLGKKAVQGAFWSAKQVGKAGLMTSSALGLGAIKASQKIGGWTISSLSSSNPILNPIGTIAKTAYKLGGSMVDYKGPEKVYNTTRKEVVRKAPSLKLTKFGAGVILQCVMM